MKITLLRWFYRHILRKNPAQMSMVSYWKTKEKVEAKVTHNEDGALIMHMDGEKHPFPGFPRGHVLFGKLSKLKHEIKNQIFNESWKLLEEGKTPEEVNAHIREALQKIFELSKETQYDQVPPQRMVPSVREIHRAWTKVSKGKKSLILRDILTFILQEDDAYRFRAQWIVTYFKPLFWWGDPIKRFENALTWLEHAEVIGDMKERIRLLRRVLLAWLKDPQVRKEFLALIKEIDWNKVKLTQADKYHFRGKYFKVDLDKFEY